jgi:hypothetical protein
MDDPDGDGLVNFLEYAFVRNPLRADAISPVLLSRHKNTGALELTFDRRKDESRLNYTVEFSSDLLTWGQAGKNGAPAAEVVRIEPLDATCERVTMRYPAGSGDRTGWLRLRVHEVREVVPDRAVK